MHDPYTKEQGPIETIAKAMAEIMSAGNPVNPVMGNPITESRDVTKGALPPKGHNELAEDLLSRFPGVDRAELLKDMVASCFFDLKYGNKREERQACDFLNEIQRIAIRNGKAK